RALTRLDQAAAQLRCTRELAQRDPRAAFVVAREALDGAVDERGAQLLSRRGVLAVRHRVRELLGAIPLARLDRLLRRTQLLRDLVVVRVLGLVVEIGRGLAIALA